MKYNSKVSISQAEQESVSKMIETTMNLLAEGKKIPDEVKEDTLSIFHLGNKWKMRICLKDPTSLKDHNM